MFDNCGALLEGMITLLLPSRLALIGYKPWEVVLSQFAISRPVGSAWSN